MQTTTTRVTHDYDRSYAPDLRDARDVRDEEVSSGGGSVAMAVILAALIIGFVIYLVRANTTTSSDSGTLQGAIQGVGNDIRDGVNGAVTPDTSNGGATTNPGSGNAVNPSTPAQPSTGGQPSGGSPSTYSQ